ncbi:hypothetical protein GPECTOR_20g489 [Gonium pectorale]|uniref:Uncharacterized protein n=1 Tax=Gonium pectorale TaxID=33097 RepID=A0A150GII9_GONPE|nr:hypothetical protein GPECTOR_20g489 [Gonium pectorale]|eukprot:KXZ49632.1 hypothetical protein GPECTOR_20g489 [Gonium pectorale]
MRPALESLCEEVDQLFDPGITQQQVSGSPLATAGAARLRKLEKALKVLHDWAGMPSATPVAAFVLLTAPPGRPALLRLLAAALRLPASDFIAGAVANANTTPQFRAGVAKLSTGAFVALAENAAKASGVALLQVYAFFLTVIRTEALHAASRQLAALGEALTQASGAGPPAVEAGAEQQDRRQALGIVAATFLGFTYGLLGAITRSQLVGAPESLHATPSQPLVAELVRALESSQVLEQAARVLVLVLVGEANPSTPAESEGAFRLFIYLHGNLSALASVLGFGDSEAAAATGARLRRALCGRCVTHATLCLGLSTLAAVDGGSLYGLDEIVRSPAVRAAAGSGNSVVAAGAGRDTLMTMLRLLETAPEPTPQRPCRRVVFSIALRAGRLDVTASAAAARERGNDPSPQPAAAFCNTLGSVAAFAFAAAALQLYPPDPTGGWSAATDLEAEVELWRLGVSALRWALPWLPAVRLQNHCRCLEEAWLKAERNSELAAYSDPLRLPPSPSRPVAAALSGGLLPCLEYLLRGAGRDPGGWQAAAVRELVWIGERFAPLLAYGDADEAAALVATLGKLLRRAQADPRVMDGVWDHRGNFCHAVLSIVSGLNPSVDGVQNRLGDRSAPEGALEAPGPEPVAAAADAVEAAP